MDAVELQQTETPLSSDPYPNDRAPQLGSEPYRTNQLTSEYDGNRPPHVASEPYHYDNNKRVPQLGAEPHQYGHRLKTEPFEYEHKHLSKLPETYQYGLKPPETYTCDQGHQHTPQKY